MKLWNKFKPVRDKHVGDVEVVADLDALISDDIAFRFGGKTYKIKPLEAGEAFIVWQNLSKLEGLTKRDEVTFTEVLDFYTDLFSSVCPEIKRSDVEQMSQPQCAALLQLILDTVTGRVFSESKKKVGMMRESWTQSTPPIS